MHWRFEKSISVYEFDNNYSIQDAIVDQRRVYWNSFIIGRWSKKWREVQDKYLQSIKSRKSSKRWAVAVIHKMILTVWDMWQFCNSLVHGPGGTTEVAYSKSLDHVIEEEFSSETTDLFNNDKHLIIDNSIKGLLQIDEFRKECCIESIQQARLAFEQAHLEDAISVSDNDDVVEEIPNQRRITDFFSR